MASLLIRRFSLARACPRRLVSGWALNEVENSAQRGGALLRAGVRGKEAHRNDCSMSWCASAAVAIAVADPGHLVRPGLVASLGHEIEVVIGGDHHVEAARVARISVEHGAGRVLVEHADARQLRH